MNDDIELPEPDAKSPLTGNVYFYPETVRRLIAEHAAAAVAAERALAMPGSRAAFESLMSDGGRWPRAIERDGDGNYVLMQTAHDWRIWQAARAAPPAQPEADHG